MNKIKIRDGFKFAFSLIFFLYIPHFLLFLRMCGRPCENLICEANN